MLNAKAFHYHNDGTGRDSYVNMASNTVSRSGKLAAASKTNQDVLGCWPDPLVSKERMKRDKLDDTLSSPQSLSGSQYNSPSPKNGGGSGDFRLENILSKHFDTPQSSPRRVANIRDGECSPNSTAGRVRLPTPRGVATPGQGQGRLNRLHFLESTTHRAARLGRYEYASAKDVPPLESHLPGIKKGCSYYGCNV